MDKKTDVLKMAKVQNSIDRLVRESLQQNLSNVAFRNKLRAEFRKIGIPDSTISTKMVNQVYNMYEKVLDTSVVLKSGRKADQRIQDLITQSMQNFENETFKNYVGFRRDMIDNILKGNNTAEEAYQEIKSKLPKKSTVTYKGRKWRFDKLCKFIIRNELQQASYDSTEEVAANLGTDVYEVSSHAGARPLCALYQGKLISTGNTREYIDLNGRRHQVIPTSEIEGYEAAGLFGYNCRHFRYPIVQGFDIPTGADPLEKMSKRVSRNIK